MPGVEADLSLGPVEAMASIGVELGKHTAEMVAWRKREWERSRVPASVRLWANAIIPSPTTRTGINLGGPDPGFYWLVRRLIVGGVAWKTAAAGTAEIYITGLSGGQGGAVTGPIISALALSDMVDQAPSLPNKAYYSNQQFMIQEQENLMVVIDSGTAAQQYVATCQIELWRTISGSTVFEQ